MRALVISAPGVCQVDDVAAPTAGPGEALIEVERAGVCGTDVEFYLGTMAYLDQGHSRYPIRIGHEWSGSVVGVGPGVDNGWLGQRVIGDTMIGDQTCARCRRGAQHTCAKRRELGIRGGMPGALAEQLVVPEFSLRRLPDLVDAELGALVEPGANAARAARAASVRPGGRVLVSGTATIGLLVALFLAVEGAEVHLLGCSRPEMAFARRLGFANVWTEGNLPALPFDGIIDASNAAGIPARALDLVEPAGRVVLIGLAGQASLIDTRQLVLKDVTAVGILSGSPGLELAIEAYATGAVDPRPLVAATVSLDQVGDVLSGRRPPGGGGGPKILVDPTL